MVCSQNLSLEAHFTEKTRMPANEVRGYPAITAGFAVTCKPRVCERSHADEASVLGGQLEGLLQSSHHILQAPHILPALRSAC